METLEAARFQMAISLGFHIVFASIGMVMPFLMVVSHFKWLRTGKQIFLDITKAWQKGVAIFFVTGAVSGTVLSFELGLLWPNFMKHAGPVIGMPFSLEGAAFFIEALAFGFYLYGWKRIANKWFHWFTGLLVGISGLASGILVVSANGWMNSPTGFDLVDGVFTNINPIAALFNKAWFTQALHMCLAAFTATGFAVAGIHAFQVLKGKRKKEHIMSFKIAIVFGAIAAILQPLSGDLSAKDIATRQPIKLAAMEAHYETERGAPLYIGGIVNEETKEVKYKIEIPKALSFLAFNDFDAEVKGLNDFPDDEIPPVAITHYAFQIMVSLGGMLMLMSFIYFLSFKFKNWLNSKWFWLAFSIASPFGFLALEAGWTVTEVGRQPWIVYKIMKTADAVTPIPGIMYSAILYLLIYFVLAISIIWLMKRQISVFNSQNH